MQGENQGFSSRHLGLGLPVEGLAADKAPAFDALGAAGVSGDLKEGAIEDGSLEADQTGLIDETARLDQPPGPGFALGVPEAVLFHLQTGPLLFQPDLTLCKGGSGQARLQGVILELDLHPMTDQPLCPPAKAGFCGEESEVNDRLQTQYALCQCGLRGARFLV